MSKIHIISLCCFLFIAQNLFSQQKTLSYNLESFGSLSSGDNTPFWMLYHNWGMVPLDANNGYVRGSTFYNQKINDDWSFNAGLDIAASTPHNYSTFWIQQLYGELDWKIYQLKIGSKEKYNSFLDPNLSSGDFVTSNNSRPIPEIRAGIPKFVPFPHAKANFYIKGDFSIGKFLDDDWQEKTATAYNRNYTKDVYSHYKSIYFRIGNIEKKPYQFTFGMNHQAMWGGNIYKYEYKKVDQPQGITDFLRVMIAKEGSGASSNTDKMYVAGSQWGSYIFKYDYRLKNEDVVSAYLHHFFDDGSGMTFENYMDNLLGLQYKSKKKQPISNAVFEYIYTKQQTGAVHFNLMMDEAHSHLQPKGNGNDNYYNNVEYIQGPSHFGRTMGTPLFLSPEYNDDGRLNFKSSRIVAFHFGLGGYFTNDLSYRLLATTGETWGRYYVPFTKKRSGFASNLDLMYNNPKLEDWEFKLSLGYNTGEFFDDDAFGVGVSIVKRGSISIK